MPDRGTLLDHGRQVLRAVDDRVVLDVRAAADLDRCLVCAQHGTKPDARACLDLHLTDQDRRRRDVRVGIDFGAMAAELEFHGRL